MFKRIAAAAALLAALAGCGEVDGASGDGGGETLTVFAAASLTETFTELGKTFEESHPGTDVRFGFAGSSTLAQQITQGAPADVFASASPATMKTVTDAGDAAGEPRVFTTNRLVIAVPRTIRAACGRCAIWRARTSGWSCAPSRCRAAPRRPRRWPRPG